METPNSSFSSTTSLSSLALSCTSSHSSSGSVATLADEVVTRPDIVIYTPCCVDRRWRSGTCVATYRFFSNEQLTGDDNYLKACFLCKKALAKNREIFMYRGDTPFCSEECREEQIVMDKSLKRCRKAATALMSSSTTMMPKPSIITNPSDHSKTNTATMAG